MGTIATTEKCQLSGLASLAARASLNAAKKTSSDRDQVAHRCKVNFTLQQAHQHTSTKHGEIHVLSRNTEEKMGRYPQASCIHDGHIGVLQQGVNAPVSGFHWDVCRTWYAINKPENYCIFIYAYYCNNTSWIASKT
jgi:hypothetical protein